MPATGSYSVGKSARNLVGRSHAYRHNGNRDRRRIGTIGIVIAGIAALSVCQRYMAVQCQRRVGSVGRSARSLVIGLVRRHIGTRSYQVHRRISMRLVSLCSYAYQHKACRDNILNRDLERQ